jgi:GH35 family endo-1,4-beta-xylanase
MKLVTSGTWTNATLIAALKNHIKNEVTNWKGQCYCWDVVNEALNDDGTWRTDVFYNTVNLHLLSFHQNMLTATRSAPNTSPLPSKPPPFMTTP